MRLRVESGERALHGAARPRDLVLVHDDRVRVDRHRVLGDAVALVPHDDGEQRRVERARGDEHVPEQAAARERVQHLGGGRLHPRALACGEDDHGSGGDGGVGALLSFHGCSPRDRWHELRPRTRTWTKGTKTLVLPITPRRTGPGDAVLVTCSARARHLPVATPRYDPGPRRAGRVREQSARSVPCPTPRVPVSPHPRRTRGVARTTPGRAPARRRPHRRARTLRLRRAPARHDGPVADSRRTPDPA